MTAIFVGFLSQVWPYLIAGIAGFAVILQQRRAGAKAERSKQAQREAKARDIADQVDNDIGALPPEEAREALKKWAR